MSLETAQLRIAQIQSLMGMSQAQAYAAKTGGTLAPDAGTSPFAATLAQAAAAPTATAASFGAMPGGSGAGGAIVAAFDREGYAGFDLFFILSGVLSLAALLFLPFITRARPRPSDEPA
jgi:hypothetical protein